MFSISSSGIGKAGLTSTLIATAAIAAMSLASAETVATYNGQSMDSSLVDAYISGRIQKPVEQATAQERSVLTNELTDVFVLSTIDLAAELEKEPAVAAQLELQRIGVIARAVVGKLAEDIVVSEEEIQAAYDEQIKMAPGQQFKARHILLQTQGEAIAVIEALIGGADFTELAKERSIDTSGPSGGDLDWFTPDQMVKQFSDAVVNLQDGRYTTDPVQTQFGWHVILREGARAAEPPPLEGVRENIIAYVQSQKLQAKIAELKAAAEE
jgi:peptidyl-prolyl cis-trans isomerase C